MNDLNDMGIYYIFFVDYKLLMYIDLILGEIFQVCYIGKYLIINI